MDLFPLKRKDQPLTSVFRSVYLQSCYIAYNQTLNIYCLCGWKIIQSDDKQSSTDSLSDSISSHGGTDTTASWQLTPQAALQGQILLECWAPPQLGEEHKPKETRASYLTEEIQTPKPKQRENSNAQFCILLVHHTENFPGFWTAEFVPDIWQPESPHRSTEEASWAAMKTEVTRNEKLSFGQTKPAIWQIFSCSGGATSVTAIGSNIPGNCSMSQRIIPDFQTPYVSPVLSIPLQDTTDVFICIRRTTTKSG